MCLVAKSAALFWWGRFGSRLLEGPAEIYRRSGPTSAIDIDAVLTLVRRKRPKLEDRKNIDSN